MNPVDDFLEGFKEQPAFTPHIEAEHRARVKGLSQLALLQREADRAATLTTTTTRLSRQSPWRILSHTGFRFPSAIQHNSRTNLLTDEPVGQQLTYMAKQDYNGWTNYETWCVKASCEDRRSALPFQAQSTEVYRRSLCLSSALVR